MNRVPVCRMRVSALGMLLLAGIPSPLLAQPKITVEEVFRVWLHRAERVRSGRFTMKESLTTAADSRMGKSMSFRARLIHGSKMPPEESKGTPSVDTTKEITRLFYFDGIKVRYLVEGERWEPACEQFLPGHYVSVFDGAVEKSFYSASEQKIFPLGFVDPNKKSSSDAQNRYVHALCMTYRAFHPTMGRFKREGWSLAPNPGVLQGRNCLILQTTDGSWKESCWVDPERDFVILRYTTQTRAEGKDTFRLDISYQHHADHGWMPSGWQAVNVDPTDGKLKESLVARVTEAALNVPIDGREFHIDFPPGTFVRDDKEGQVYILRETGQKRVVTDEELGWGATYEQLLATESGMAGRPSSRATVGWILVGNAILIGGLVIWRLRARKKGVRSVLG